MELGPFTLDDERARKKIVQILKEGRPLPFGEELDAWLGQHWGENSQDTPPCPISLAGMIREEDVPIVLDQASSNGRLKEAFYLLWASGLFEDAGCLLKQNPEVKEEIGFDYIDDDGTAFEASYMLSKWNIWNGPKGVLASLYYDSRRLWSDPIYAHRSGPPRTVTLTREPGSEKERVARAIHHFAGGSHFELVDCSNLSEVPQEQIERCQFRGTIFFSQVEALTPEVRSHVLQIINERRLLKRMSTATGEITERLDLDSLFILGYDSPPPGFNGFSQFFESATVPIGLVKQLPSLSNRLDDLPLLVNKVFLEVGVTDLDDVRHWVADRLAKFYQINRPAGGIDWLINEVIDWIRVFSPTTEIPTPPLENADVEAAVRASSNKIDQEVFTEETTVSWEQVRIDVVDDENITIIKGTNDIERWHYSQIGFSDRRRTTKPRFAWIVFLEMAENGEITWNSTIEYVPQDSVQSAIQTLRKLLRKQLGMAEDPFKVYRKEKAWRPRFQLTDKRYGGQGAAAARAEGRI